MKLAYLTEVAVLMAAHHRLFIQRAAELPNQVIGDYYLLSRNRFNRWARDLSDLENGLGIRDPLHQIGLSPSIPATRSVTEQILINEMLLRIWTVLLIAGDVEQGVDRVRPVAHNVFLGHVSLRQKAMSVCCSDGRMTHRDALAIEKTKAAVARWTDMLCCQLMNEYNLWQYAFDKDCARDFLKDRSDQGALKPSSQAWIMILTGMRHSFPEKEGFAAPLHNDDRLMTRLLMASFPDTAPEMTFWMGNKLRQAKSC